MSAYKIAENEGLVEVAHAGNYDYSWSETQVWWSPKAKRFYWFDDSGCSCYYYGESCESFSEFEDGDKAAAIRAIEDYADDAEEAKRAIRDWVTK